MADYERLNGVRGWLLLFVVGSILIGPLFAIGRTSGDLSGLEDKYPALVTIEAWRNYKFAVWTVVAIALSLSIYVGTVLINDRTPFAPKLAFNVLVINSVIVGAINYFVLPYVFLKDLFQLSLAENVGPYIGGILSSSIWMLYLKKSKRVKVTYRMLSVEEYSSTAVIAGSEQPKKREITAASPAVKKDDQVSTPARRVYGEMVNTTASAPKSRAADDSSSNDTQSEERRNAMYELALSEIQSDSMVKGLWARAFAEHEGDELKTKAKYIKLRVEQLSKSN